MRYRLLFAILVLFALGSELHSQNFSHPKTIKISADSLGQRVRRHMGYGQWDLVIKKINKVHNSQVDIVFGEDIMSWAWSREDLDWLREEISKEFELEKGLLRLGKISANKIDMEELVTPVLGNSGKASPSYRYRVQDPRKTSTWPFIREDGGRVYDKGLSHRHIALWQSHGNIYSTTHNSWGWQRAKLHRTVEDMYTQSYVLPLLIPMLENAGAYVMTPRERDTQRLEVVCDNDPAFKGERGRLTRQVGDYSETGHWSNAGVGFGDTLRWYSTHTNPFTMGTARKTKSSDARKPSARARWTPNVKERGRYAVYISYKSFPNSVTDARYTIKHMGGESVYLVNQRRGGGTWIYLGTFDFAPQGEYYVELDNHSVRSGNIVCADAVRFGGGMGKVQRGGEGSGLPAYCEGALYSMIWAGCDSTLFTEWDNDYTRDYAARGRWCKDMRDTRDIPFDMAFAFHTDAGTTPNDSIVGTLGIYTLRNEGKRELKGGGDRMCSRTLVDMVQSQIVNDLQSDFDPQWSRRRLWDKSYSECRTNDMPAMILELLSHQNFSDMRYGLDPSFRFTTSRAVYKGILKFLSELYGCPYMVQPLPVQCFEARLEGSTARLSWKPREDEKEPTAISEAYILYTRIDDGAFDLGVEVKDNKIDIELEPGHIYSFKVEAYNQGGKSFPSEILSIALASESKGKVLIVNNFDRVSAPSSVDSPGYAGFDSRFDSGVPYISDISYIGENYEFRRSLRWESDSNPGFGASWDNMAGEIVAGNTFDYPSVHGKSLLKQGYSFESMSRSSFEEAVVDSSVVAIDLICGKQRRTIIGNGRVSERYEVFPKALRESLSKWLTEGCHLIISGSNIATDPFQNSHDSATSEFVSSFLGYKYLNSFGTYSDKLLWGKTNLIPYHKRINSECYCIECPNALSPSNKKAKVWIKYDGTKNPAGVAFASDNYKVISLGIPIECIREESDRDTLLGYALEYLSE